MKKSILRLVAFIALLEKRSSEMKVSYSEQNTHDKSELVLPETKFFSNAYGIV